MRLSLGSQEIPQRLGGKQQLLNGYYSDGYKEVIAHIKNPFLKETLILIKSN